MTIHASRSIDARRVKFLTLTTRSCKLFSRRVDSSRLIRMTLSFRIELRENSSYNRYNEDQRRENSRLLLARAPGFARENLKGSLQESREIFRAFRVIVRISSRRDSRNAAHFSRRRSEPRARGWNFVKGTAGSCLDRDQYRRRDKVRWG